MEGWVRCEVVVVCFVISSKICDFMNIIKIQEENIKVYKVKLWIILQITWKKIMWINPVVNSVGSSGIICNYP